MPTGWLNAYAHMYGRLRDEEQLRAIAAAAVGTGAMREDAREEYMRELQDGAGVARPRARPATLADLADIGIRVVTDE